MQKVEGDAGKGSDIEPMMKCGKCKEAIEGRYVTALDKEWHERCFVCSKCSKALTTSFMERNNLPTCVECAKKK